MKKLLGAIAGLTAASLLAAGYELTGVSIGSPPQSLSGGGYTMQARPGAVQGNGLAGGGYSGTMEPVPVGDAALVVPGAATLFVTRVGDSIIFSWFDDGVVLQSSTTLDGQGSWTPVEPAPTVKSTTVSAGAGEPRRFYRLQRP